MSWLRTTKNPFKVGDHVRLTMSAASGDIDLIELVGLSSQIISEIDKRGLVRVQGLRRWFFNDIFERL